MDQRVQVFKRCKVYGYHGQTDRVAEHVQNGAISESDAVQAYRQGASMRQRGQRCDCSRCAG